MKMTSCKKLKLKENILAAKKKPCRRREKEDRIPGQKVGRSSSSGHQPRATAAAASQGASVRNARGHQPPSWRWRGGCSSTKCTPHCKQMFAQGDTVESFVSL